MAGVPAKGSLLTPAGSAPAVCMGDPLLDRAAAEDEGRKDGPRLVDPLGRGGSDLSGAEDGEDREREEVEQNLEEEEEDGGYVGADEDLEDQFAGMNLHGEETEDLDFSGEVDDLIREVRWLGIFRVHTTRPFGHSALLNQMRNAWAAAKGVTFNIKGPNLFLVQCHCLGDWKRIMEGGPWLFRKAPVVIQEYDGFSDVSQYKLNKIPVWARIKGLPPGLTAKKALAEKVVAKVGGPPFTVMVNEGVINPNNSLRARVYLDVNEPLVRFVPITLRESKRYPVAYEKLPDFCFRCGLMGHIAEECGDGVHDPRTFEWGDWLLWAPEQNPGVQPDRDDGGRGATRGRAGGRGERGGRQGRGDRAGGRNNAGRGDEVGEDVNYQTGQGGAGEKNIRKRLVSPDGTMNIRGQPVPNLAGKVADTVLMLEGGSTSTGNEGEQKTPGKVPIVKRRKQGETGDAQRDELMSEAASREEDR
nr:uncharacterized protein LOC109767640 [Aegilops tauschii subsp. strangulata]